MQFQTYRARWKIKMFFRVLTNGFRIDALQLESIEKMERAVAPHMVVARRIARLFHLSCAVLDLNAQRCSSPINGRQFSYRKKGNP